MQDSEYKILQMDNYGDADFTLIYTSYSTEELIIMCYIAGHLILSTCCKRNNITHHMLILFHSIVHQLYKCAAMMNLKSAPAHHYTGM